jgi:hypothetical protein
LIRRDIDICWWYSSVVGGFNRRVACGSFFHMKLELELATTQKKRRRKRSAKIVDALRHQFWTAMLYHQMPMTGTTPWEVYTTILLNNSKQQCFSNHCLAHCWSSSSQSPRNFNSSSKCSTKADSSNSNNLRMLVQTRPGTSRDMKMVRSHCQNAKNCRTTVSNNSL